MRCSRIFVLLAAAAPLCRVAAQDLVITNAHVISGNGTVINGGSVVIRDGRIESLAIGPVDPGRSAHIDAGGRTVMPGLIDTHTHTTTDTITNDMNGYLEMGFTTVLTQAIIGQIRVGPSDRPLPRLLTTGPAAYADVRDILTNFGCRLDSEACEGVVWLDDPALVDGAVRSYVEAGADAIKAQFGQADPPFIFEQEMPEEIFAAYAEAADAYGIPLLVHALRLSDALRAVELGADALMHAPLAFAMGDNVEKAARRLADASIPISTTVHGFSPAEGEDGVQRVHDGREYTEEDTLLSAASMTRLRRLWDAGVTLAFGTDSVPDANRFPRPPSSAIENSRAEFVAHEIETLHRVFSPPEVVTMMTQNASVFLGLDDEIGTIEPGKLADIVIVDGNPLVDISALTNVAVVIQEGEVVVDHR